MIRVFLKKLWSLIQYAGLILFLVSLGFGIFKLLGLSSLTTIVTGVALGVYIYRSHKKLHETMIKVHKNNITNQESLMKEIKRAGKDKRAD